MSPAQRAEAFAALEKAGAGGADAAAQSSGQGPGKRGRREDALGTAGVERVAAQGCPHCAGREIVGWGRSDGLLRFRCKSCGRTFNALTKTPMAHLRKKEKWLDHARAMIEGKSLAKRARPKFPFTPCLRRESRPPRRRICTSTTSTPTIAASSNG